ncbi:MAG: immune inhibitor A [Ignavibacteriales bacterium]|nr:immune inhibitor A [Ignavibacteriales bacterium]
MKYFLTLLLTLTFFISAYSQNYKQVKIYVNDKSDYAALQTAGLEIDHAFRGKDNSLTVYLSDEQFSKLQLTNFRYDVLIDDWLDYYSKQPTLSETEKSAVIQQSKNDFGVEGFGFGSMGGFLTLAEINARLDSMFALYPNIITQKFSIGTTVEGRPIYVVKISDNPNVNENEPQVFYNSLIHCREPQGMMTVMYYMYYLLENYGTDPEVTYLVNNREIYFQPVVNPDGYEYNRTTNPNGGGDWRKNRKNNGDGSYGIDLNRNFGYQWGYNNSGSSNIPSDLTYRGPFAFSEPETQAIRDFVNTKTFKTALNYHTYSNLLLYPWGYETIQTPDNNIFVEYSTDMVAYNGYENGQPPVILYDVNGSTDDWMYGEQTSKPKILSMTPEVGSTGFWPTQAEIFPLAIENLQPNLYMTWVAGESVSLINPNFSQQFFNPGDIVDLIIPQIRNKGLSDATNVSLSLSSDNPLITITSGNINVGNIATRTTYSNSQNLSFTIGSTMPADVNVKMLVTVSTSGTPMFVDTLSFITGTPIMVFADTTNDPLLLWNITYTPTTSPKWEASTTSYHTSPSSFTDSKTGSYTNNATVTMTQKNAIDLSSYAHPRLSFWTKYDIESNYDYGQVEISTNNGSTFTPLAGNFTQPGTGSFQPNGEPLYDGVQSSWVNEEMDLTSYNSNQVKLKFELKTDGSLTKDGWYIDDIGILVYGIVPVELSSFTAIAQDKNILLNWITSSETNNMGFDIERRSSKSNTSWQKLGFTSGKGTTTEKSTYSFVDENPIKGKSFYRLKQIDFDGSFKIYNSVEVDYGTVDEYSLAQNYPNPFNPSTEINFSLAKSSSVTLKVYNILGSEVVTLVNDFMEAGKHTVQFNAKDFTSGVYFYTIKADNFTSTRKMILMK